jgi:hypothetical protein
MMRLPCDPALAAFFFTFSRNRFPVMLSFFSGFCAANANLMAQAVRIRTPFPFMPVIIDLSTFGTAASYPVMKDTDHEFHSFRSVGLIDI